MSAAVYPWHSQLGYLPKIYLVPDTSFVKNKNCGPVMKKYFLLVLHKAISVSKQDACAVTFASLLIFHILKSYQSGL